MIDDLVSNVKGFIMTPSEMFKKTSGNSLSAAYQYYVVLLVIFTVLFGIVAVSIGLAIFTSMVAQMAVIPIVGNVISSAASNFSGFVIALGVFFVYLLFLFYLLGVFVEGLIIHAFVVLMGGEKGAKQTIKTTMYSSTPFLLLGWIPIVSMYCIYLVDCSPHHRHQGNSGNGAREGNCRRANPDSSLHYFNKPWGCSQHRIHERNLFADS